MKFIVYQTESPAVVVGYVLAEDPYDAIKYAKIKYREPAPLVRSWDGEWERVMVENWHRNNDDEE